MRYEGGWRVTLAVRPVDDGTDTPTRPDDHKGSSTSTRLCTPSGPTVSLYYSTLSKNLRHRFQCQAHRRCFRPEAAMKVRSINSDFTVLGTGFRSPCLELHLCLCSTVLSAFCSEYDIHTCRTVCSLFFFVCNLREVSRKKVPVG